jgi:small subunit ribosomal protein S21
MFENHTRKPRQERQISRHFEVEVRGDDVMKAWRKLKKKLMKERVLEEVKERRYYQKPSEKKRETKKLLRRQALRLRRKQMEKEGF